tara:strand:- start:1067 stop:1279 length:213 start_codon:yes stop_codon:yes gene_type:complete
VSGNRYAGPLRKKNMSNKELINALKEELKGYEVNGKAKRAEEVKKAIKALGGKAEKAEAKPKAEKKVEKK